MTNEAADILRKAKELIETKGWTQKAFGITPEGSRLFDSSPSTLARASAVCVEGALCLAERKNICFISNAPYQFLKTAAGVGRNGRLFEWNDRAGRTLAEVLSAFNRAIALAEAEK